MTRAFAFVLALCTGLAAHAGPVRVATYNIRYGTASDGPDRWEVRRERVFETIRDLDADVIGLQEVLSFQLRELLKEFPQYAAAGVHRDDGMLAGEAAPVLYDHTRYALAATGTFWLSDTPEVVASNTWDAACTRICTWAKLLDLESGETFTIFNTHFDHESRKARDNAAKLIIERITARADSSPFLVTGDLNSGEETDAVRTLLDGADDWKLTDTYRAIHPEGAAGTFTGFNVDSDAGARKIDYVFTSPGWQIARSTGATRRTTSRCGPN